jgi:NADPH:quinone reductase-like Zn-dependent oxidoreductase
LRDCLIRRGLDYNVTDPVGLPAVSGSDFVGTVFLCGRNVTKFNPGDRVAGLLRSGGNARYTQVSQDALVRVPKRIDGGEAACMVSVYSTAYHAIAQATKDTDVRELKGKRVLVVGGMDGVGQAIIQMCRKAKANVFATAPDRRHAYVRSILKANPLPENSKDWSRSINGSMDYVFDGVFEGSMESSLRVLKDSGKCICFGTSSFLQEHMGWFGVPLHRRFERFQLEVHTNFEYVDLWDVYTRDREEYKVR